MLDIYKSFFMQQQMCFSYRVTVPFLLSNIHIKTADYSLGLPLLVGNITIRSTSLFNVCYKRLGRKSGQVILVE